VRYLRCPAACDNLSAFGFFFSPPFCWAFSPSDRFAGGGAEAIPCGLRSLLIVSWFSFIVTCLLRLVFWDDLRRPVYEMMMTNG
jgi:hypothetical protein